MSEYLEQKQEIVEIGRRIWGRGLCAGNEGNHSIRVGENLVLCTPSQISKGFMTAQDVCHCDMTGAHLAGGNGRKRTSEVLLHLAIYKTRPDVRAIVHGHPPHATAFALSGVDLPSMIHPEAEVFLGKVPTVPYVTPGDHRLGDSVVPYCKFGNALLLGQHGVVTFDTSLEKAYYAFEVIEQYAKILLLTKQIGSIKVFDDEQVRGLLALKERFGIADARLQSGDSNMADSGEFARRVNG